MKKTTLFFVGTWAAVLSVLFAAAPSIGAPSSVTISQLLTQLRVDDSKSSQPIASKEFQFPIDADNDGCNTVKEFLVRASQTKVKVGKNCQLSGGMWSSAFYSQPLTLKDGPKVLPMVSIQEALASGAQDWSSAQKVQFANDLGYNWAMIVLPKNIAAAKGVRDISGWLPQARSAKCLYISAFLATKYRWGLTIDKEELAVAQKYGKSCGRDGTVVKPRVFLSSPNNPVPQPTSPAAPTPSIDPNPSAPTPNSPVSPSPSPSVSPSPSPSVSPSPSPSVSPSPPGNQNLTFVYSASLSTSPSSAWTTEATSFSAVVVDQFGNASPGISVSFKFRSSSSTSIYTSMGSAVTDSSGVATLLYRFASEGTPQVFAGSEATADYARFWSTGHTVTVVAPVFTASFSNPPARALTTQETTFSAVVRDQYGSLAAGITVTFKFRPNTSTAIYTSMGSAVTDSSGVATLQYRFASEGTPQVFAGSEATADYARFWSTGHTLTAAAPVFTASFSNPPASALTTQAIPFSVVVVDQYGFSTPGISVSFKFRPNTSTSIYTSMGSAVTDSSGVATLQYRFTTSGTPQVFAGSDATSDYQNFWTTGQTVTVAAPIFTATFSNPPGSALTTQATTFSAVVRDQNGAAVSGIPVSFKFRPNTSTSIYTSMGSAVTDSSGVATLQYRFTTSGTPQVFAGSDATSDYQSFSTTGHTLTTAAPVLTASFSNPPASALTTQDASLTAIVRDQYGNAAVGITVNFKFRPNTSTSIYTSMGSAVSDSSGAATLQYRFASAGTPQVFAGSEATSEYQRFWSSGHTVTVRVG